MTLKYFYLIANFDNDLICLLMIMKIICWCWLTVGSWIMFVVFLNDTFHWRKHVCIKKWTCKISARFPSLTEMSRDRKVPWPKRPDRNGQTETVRPNWPDRKVAYPPMQAKDRIWVNCKLIIAWHQKNERGYFSYIAKNILTTPNYFTWIRSTHLYVGMRFHLYFSFTMFCIGSFFWHYAYLISNCCFLTLFKRW